MRLIVLLLNFLLVSLSNAAITELWSYSDTSGSITLQNLSNSYQGFSTNFSDGADLISLSGGGLWGASGNTIAQSNNAALTHTFNNEITSIAAGNANSVLVALSNGELWSYSDTSGSITLQNLSNSYQGFSMNFSDGADLISLSGGGLWGASGNTIAQSNNAALTHTFNNEITSIAAGNANSVLVALSNGELWSYSDTSGSITLQNLSNSYQGFSTNFSDGADLISLSGGGLWGASGNTIAQSNNAALTHTFNNEITSIAAGNANSVLVVTSSTIPIPATTWLFGSALFGLSIVSIQRAKKR